MIWNYAGLLNELHRLITGDDSLSSEIPSATLESVLLLGQRKLYRDVRSRHNEKVFASVVATNNLAPIPSDWEATSTVHFGKDALLPRSEDWVRSYLQGNPTGDCIYFAEAGDSYYFAPAVADGTAVQGRYFCRFDDLTAENIASNALYQAEPDLFLYAALSESGEFFPVGQRLQVWEAKYQGIVGRINNAKDRAAYSGGRIQRTPSARVMR